MLKGKSRKEKTIHFPYLIPNYLGPMSGRRAGRRTLKSKIERMRERESEQQQAEGEETLMNEWIQ